MSRFLLACFALLGLGLASCSSSASMHEDHLDIDRSINTDPVNPHPRGLAGAGRGFDKYWLGNNPTSPFSYEDEERGFFSLFFGGEKSFGEATERDWRPMHDLYARESGLRSLNKWVMNEDSNDPYVR